VIKKSKAITIWIVIILQTNTYWILCTAKHVSVYVWCT